MKGRRVLVGVGGGIAAFKVAALVSRLVQRGAEVRVAMTRAATEFVGPLTFAGLSGQPPILRATQIDPDGSVPHIAAARAADVFVIAPATADLLAKLAAGVADDPVCLLALTFGGRKLLCPAMNDAMWCSEPVQRAVDHLRRRGFEVLGPVVGHLAEGYDAVGRMVEPDTILEALS
ncbi:MAG: flavoprotein [Planctomycetota bacterium]